MDKIVTMMKFMLSFKGVCIVIVSLCVWVLFQQFRKRRKYIKILPSQVIGLIQVLGLRKYPEIKLPPTAVVWLFTTAMFHLFKKETLFAVWLGFTPFINLNKPEAVEVMLTVAGSYGEKWKSRRKLLTPAFHFEILKDFLPVINEKSMLLVKIFEKEVYKDYTSILPPITLCSLDIICETTLGINLNCQENKDSEYVQAVKNVSDELTKRITSVISWYDFTFFLTKGRSIRKDLTLLHSFTMSVIQERKKDMLRGEIEGRDRKRKPLMDLLLQHHIETKELTEKDIREEVDTFAFEGHDTTSLAMTWALYFIGLYKDVQAKIHEELDQIFGDDKERPVTAEDLKYLKYLECVLKESLRLNPSVPVIGRKADKDMAICGYPIPKGASLIICPYMMHRNEEFFPNPEVFDPDRFTPENSAHRHPYAYIPFSAGSRNCIGQRFAMIEEKIVVANILRNYSLESLDPRDKVLSTLELILRPLEEVRIKLRRR
ncbi:cytochrome P450 4V2 isoform X2 [Parasteatoda tepidariorum]|uniref:cytochrome P450 4V2 isoform X2 n=1 Tax=Parasteatoda tepidariorum TaxID=114398 RepID=UPI001C71F587|nr:cytochrome P450 4V2 isoform X2 [Parasteatoda tepidariorum]